ncbi:RcnB family protein [Luteimonas sp. YGD11-2]|uniref:RcnB family protein n=1 Tax=Luteimonas sp. YGD11-2 TaxID=2508168 RepID=UPI001F51143B|nr:RcnB family protein [Luteimonas sp. YGD11-2]
MSSRTAMLALAVALAVAAPAALADPPPHARGKGPPAHAGGPHGAPPGWVKNAWREGERLPLVELDGYWVSDYERYHLHAPPPGHRWVRQDDDRYLLVAAATGIIVDILTR